MNPFENIRAWFIWLTQLLVQVALDCYNSPLLPDFLGDIFNNMSTWTARVSGYLFDLEEWYDWVADRVSQVFNEFDILDIVLSWFPDLEEISSWFSGWWNNVRSVITSWWSATSGTVRAWIDAAVAELEGLGEDWLNFWNSLWPQLVAGFNSLTAAWDNFRTVTLPGLVSWDWLDDWWDSRLDDVEALINSALAGAAGLWDGWQDVREEALEFFQDPLEFLWGKFADWFLGPEE